MRTTPRSSPDPSAPANPTLAPDAPGIPPPLTPADFPQLAQLFKIAVEGEIPRQSGPPGPTQPDDPAPAAGPLAPPLKLGVNRVVDTDNAVSFPNVEAPIGDLPDADLSDVDQSEPNTLGAAMLQSLAQQSSTAPAFVFSAPAEVAPTAPTSRIEKLEQIIAETVSRVLVSDPLHEGRREVRLQFAREVLPDTEVRIWRQEGRLHVEFISTPAVADSTLRDGLPRLAEAMQQRQPQSELPVVSLQLQAATGTGSQPGDGRSRQQYLRLDETEDQA